MDYNTSRSHLVIPEYGRNIQTMIEHLNTIEDRETRTKSAHFIVNVMAQMHPQLKESADYKHKLWDHMHLIAGFKLDVDAPYPLPPPDILQAKPKHIGYNTDRIKYGHYGKYIIEIIKKVAEFEEGEEKSELVNTIANHMKKSYLTWNRDSVTDATIADNLAELSKGELTITEDAKLIATSEVLQRNNVKKKKHNPRKDNQSYQRKSNRHR
jgi:hypothetical protein